MIRLFFVVMEKENLLDDDPSCVPSKNRHPIAIGCEKAF